MEETQQHIEASSETHTEAQLVELVKKQVEYYFSKENLLVDPFLSSQMDAQMCVPISVVMKVSDTCSFVLLYFFMLYSHILLCYYSYSFLN